MANFVKDKFKKQIPITIKKSLLKYQVKNDLNQIGMQVKMGTLGKMLDKEYYL